MSGPALKQLDAHHAIHEAAFHEAQEMTVLFHHLVEKGDSERAVALAEAILDHWKTRTLRHAADEEIGFYQECREAMPHRAEEIAQLIRDHDLMRNLVAELEQLLSHTFDSRAISFRLDALLWVNEIHSRDEERCLLDGQALRTNDVKQTLEESEPLERQLQQPV
ncbi:hypothetical protein Alches_12040 [Alicyclobacillus hesperidum subsp. aegles]|uniref:hemerythrin domain-containing protein n=1 Tax=Alicyclobacillus hesperidum TaxID=89784 RepID=UPI00071932DE|nr:hemerythrin domain-containing protein [Alicyclobacillus hesperidum]GLG01165.1 hypothetical protein Alches_12040 [Alicyclobacillus hesperidum subsp. aegles]